MSLLRALRRVKPAGAEGSALSTVELSGTSVLRCFEIPSRRNVVEPFATNRADEGEGDFELRDADAEARLNFRSPHKELGALRSYEPPKGPISAAAVIGDPYQNLWSPTPSTSKIVPMQIETSIPVTAQRRLSGLPPIDLSTAAASVASNFAHEMEREWNEEFQAILKKPLLERGTELAKLCDEFVEAAQSIGQVIIREHNLPAHQKTFKPLRGKGRAGGEKFKVANIFFKFAVNPGDSDLYASDHCAMKVAGHELKGLTALVSCGMMLGLNFPLLALIDYRGFRLIATSTLPISENTLVYGSCDAGVTVHDDSPELNSMMEKIANVLNLKGHWTGIGDKLKWLHGPCDIEGHGAPDGKLYVVDTARLWPCEIPDKSVKGGFLFRMLRPELVKNSPTPLSSDAFTLFGHHDAEVHNAEVTEATLHLFEDVIPDFAQQLDEHGIRGDLTEELHRVGINCRHLGAVRQQAKSESAREQILLEITARVIKNMLRAEMRALAERDEGAYRALALRVFKTVFGHEGDTSAFLWTTRLRGELLAHFQQALFPHELEPSYNLMHHLDLPKLFRRVQDLTGITFRKGTDPRAQRLTNNELLSMHAKTKHMYAVPRIQADTLAEIARTKTATDAEEAMRLYTAARGLYQSVIKLKPDDTTVLLNLGTVLAEQAKLTLKASSPLASMIVSPSSCPPAKRLFELAYDKFGCALSLRPSDHRALMRWANALSEHAESEMDNTSISSVLYAAAADKYKRAHLLRTDDSDILFNWGNLMRNHAQRLIGLGMLPEAEKLLMGALTRYRKALESPSAARGPTPMQTQEQSTQPQQRQHSHNRNDKLTIDTLINCGCGLLALGKVRHALRTTSSTQTTTPTATEVTCFDQAKIQFMKAVALIKRGGFQQSHPEDSKKYLSILSTNLHTLSLLQSRCEPSSTLPTSQPASPLPTLSPTSTPLSTFRPTSSPMLMVDLPSLHFTQCDTYSWNNASPFF